MKTLLTLIISIFLITEVSSQNSIETQSVALEDFITFIANQFPLEIKEDTSNAKEDATETPKTQQISFILETSKTNFSSEDKIILQQAFKFLATRLNKEDKISLLAYSGQNGLLLDRISAKGIKKTLSVINDLKNSITETHKDGIALAYKLAQEHFNENADNLVVMVRNPNATQDTAQTETIREEDDSAKSKVIKSKNSNVVLLTAMTLLPELITIIKD
ncbi:hypothetical protein [Lacinutrix chionoecetis]